MVENTKLEQGLRRHFGEKRRQVGEAKTTFWVAETTTWGGKDDILGNQRRQVGEAKMWITFTVDNLIFSKVKTTKICTVRLLWYNIFIKITVTGDNYGE